MPIPGPINSHRARSRGFPSANLGYHLIGTDTVRPSCNSTMRLSAVTRTLFAAAFSVPRLKVVMPPLHQLGLVPPNQHFHLLQLGRRKATVVFQSNRLEPELSRLSLSRYVNVHWFAAVAREEEEPIRHSGGPWDSPGDFASFRSCVLREVSDTSRKIRRNWCRGRESNPHDSFESQDLSLLLAPICSGSVARLARLGKKCRLVARWEPNTHALAPAVQPMMSASRRCRRSNSRSLASRRISGIADSGVVQIGIPHRGSPT
jgi:hypothetical protein